MDFTQQQRAKKRYKRANTEEIRWQQGKTAAIQIIGGMGSMAAAKSMGEERVIAILEYYKNIDGEISFYRKLIKNDEDTYYNTIGAVASDGLPHGKNNISRITENAAMNVPDGVFENMQENEKKISELCQLKAQIIREISRLEFKEKSVIYDFYINNLKWEQVSVRNHYTERQCRNIRDKAIGSLIPKFQKNIYIASFEISA